MFPSPRNGCGSAGRRAKHLSRRWLIERYGWRRVLNRDYRFDRTKRTAGSGVAACLAASLALSLTTAPADARDRSLPLKPQAQDRGPLLIVVSLRKQKLRAYDINGEIASTRVSTGMPGFDTPPGVFSVLEKKVSHFSNIYAGAPMPFMQRLTWSGIALHAGVVPGYRASHGCIRLPHSFAKSLFGLTRPGVRVIVAQDEAQPSPFHHPALFKPLPERASSQVASIAGEARMTAGAGDAADALSDFPSVLGVTPALAAAVKDFSDEPRRPATRGDAERRVSGRVAAANSAIKIAAASKESALEAATAADKSADTAAVRLAPVRRAVAPGQRAASKAQGELAAATRAFEAAMSASSVLSGTDAEDREADLEDAILDASAALAKAQAAIARGELELAAVEAEAAAAERARSSARADVRRFEADQKSAEAELVAAQKDAARRAKPVSVLISLKAGRVYVRQGFESVIEAPIRLNEQPRKIGTYVLTAMQYRDDNPDEFDWRLVTAQSPSFAGRDTDKRNRRSAQRDLPPVDGAAGAVLAAALESIELPDDVMSEIRERARPGASLIITDRELKQNENGLNTEFVLHTAR